MAGTSELGAYLKIFEILSDVDSFKVYKKEASNNFDDYLKSYQFCLSFCLDRIFDLSIVFPEMFEIKNDLLIERARQNRVDRKIFPKNSKLGFFLINLNSFMEKILKSKNERELTKIIDEIKKMVIFPLKDYIGNSRNIDEKFKKYSMDDLFLRMARFYTYIYMNDYGKMKISYNHLFLKNKILFAQSIKIQEKLNKKPFFEGYKQILDFLWWELLGKMYDVKIFGLILKKKNWEQFDSGFELLRDKFIKKLEKKNEIIDPTFKSIFWLKSKREGNLPKDLFIKDLYPKKIKLSRKEFLDRIFFWYPVRIIGANLSVNNTFGFISLLKGLIGLRYKKTKDKIKILKFKHKGYYESVFSFAILIEGFSTMADYSQWYLFLEFCTNGPGMEGSAYDEINRHLYENKKLVDVRKIEIHPLYLHHYARDNLLKSNLEYASNLEEYKSLAKGTTFELFVSYLFNLKGYKTRWSLKKRFTQGKEIDILCFKTRKNEVEILIVEVSTENKDIRGEIDNKIKILKQNQEELLSYLDIPKNFKCNYIGKMITLNKKIDYSENKIEILDLDDLIKICKKKGVNLETIKKLIIEEKKKSLEEMSADEILKRYESNHYSNK